ncbi:transcriptional regulator [Azoarcus sp. DD4]|uniref:TfoX/Sxy family protein n=1 Tax=Azoarcus sp. DD4 TaxID=2027405 RepID=UPI00112963D3|nr:TfoX/Sxy family protein [Azoarcus sp. DD4]QDF97685.1 transcriptional regulator [Azoarcus sp. DD4]
MNEYVAYLEEVFERFGAVSARRMFGGYGIYHDGLMFGLVVDDTLYLKADAQSVGEFEAQGLLPFEYVRSGKPIRLSYYRAPDDILDDRDLAAIWAQRALAAALRAGGRKPGPSKRRPLKD